MNGPPASALREAHDDIVASMAAHVVGALAVTDPTLVGDRVRHQLEGLAADIDAIGALAGEWERAVDDALAMAADDAGRWYDDAAGRVDDDPGDNPTMGDG